MRYPQSHLSPTTVLPCKQGAEGTDLAIQFQQNWLSKNPMMEHLVAAQKDTLDDSLTSLNWLQNMNLNIGEATPPISPRIGPSTSEATRVNPNQVLATNLRQNQWPFDIQTEALDPSISFDKLDYKNNPCVKPPYR